MAHLRRAVILLRDAHVSLRLNKCLFHAAKINFFGDASRPGQLKLSEEKTVAVRVLKSCTTEMELKFFSGLYNVFQRLVANLSRVAAPLNKKLRKD